MFHPHHPPQNMENHRSFGFHPSISWGPQRMATFSPGHKPPQITMAEQDMASCERRRLTHGRRNHQTSNLSTIKHGDSHWSRIITIRNIGISTIKHGDSTIDRYDSYHQKEGPPANNFSIKTPVNALRQSKKNNRTTSRSPQYHTHTHIYIYIYIQMGHNKSTVLILNHVLKGGDNV